MTARWQPKKLAERAARLRDVGRPDDAAQVERILAAAGHCKHCGRPLSDPVSVERGVGPDCWQKQP